MTYLLSVLIVSALATFFLRAFPLLFTKFHEMPESLIQLGKTLPPAIMAVLVVYCLKDVPYSIDSALVMIPSAIVTALSYKWKHSTFLSILLGTVVSVLLSHII